MSVSCLWYILWILVQSTLPIDSKETSSKDYLQVTLVLIGLEALELSLFLRGDIDNNGIRQTSLVDLNVPKVLPVQLAGELGVHIPVVPISVQVQDRKIGSVGNVDKMVRHVQKEGTGSGRPQAVSQQNHPSNFKFSKIGFDILGDPFLVLGHATIPALNVLLLDGSVDEVQANEENALLVKDKKLGGLFPSLNVECLVVFFVPFCFESSKILLKESKAFLSIGAIVPIVVSGCHQSWQWSATRNNELLVIENKHQHNPITFKNHSPFSQQVGSIHIGGLFAVGGSDLLCITHMDSEL